MFFRVSYKAKSSASGFHSRTDLLVNFFFSRAIFTRRFYKAPRLPFFNFFFLFIKLRKWPRFERRMFKTALSVFL